VWAEDAYVVVADGGGLAFVEPAAFPRFGDALVADQVSEAAGMGLYQAPLHLQGGNVLVGDDFFLVGIDYPLLTFEEGILEAQGQAGQDAVLRDVYRRFLDAERRSSRSARRCPSRPRRGASSASAASAGCKSSTRATTPARASRSSTSTCSSRSRAAARTAVTACSSATRARPRLTGEPLQAHAMAPVFDDVARGLAGRGFDVTRAPLPLVYVDDADARVRSWYFATSCNVLVHAPAGERPVVFLPTYAHGPFAATLDATDTRNAEIWEGLGYDVVALADFHPFAANLGAAHCIKKYLARG
jgi:hypothetical protein